MAGGPGSRLSAPPGLGRLLDFCSLAGEHGEGVDTGPDGDIGLALGGPDEGWGSMRP